MRARGIFALSPAPALVLMIALLVGCSSPDPCGPLAVTSEESCSITLDCVESGLSGLECVNGRCSKTCRNDADCKIEASETPILSSAEEEASVCEESSEQPVVICESQLCVAGCPDAPCTGGEVCVEEIGRCAYFFESFEPRPGQDFATPTSLGWNSASRSLENRETIVAFEGAPGCALGGDRCAGPALLGRSFVALERVPTPERGTPELGVTCKACACCLECRLDPDRARTAAVCPDLADPSSVLMCFDAPPSTICEDACAACADCPESVALGSGEGLLACESEAANKSCTSCAALDECIRTLPPVDCDGLRDGCFACRDAIQCERATPGSAECTPKRGLCESQGNDGCFPAAVGRPRSQLFDEEQALESPEIDLSEASLGVIIQLNYVPFNIRETYRRTIQERAPAEWPIEAQEVVVELCGQRCEDAESWVDARLDNGRPASFPPVSARGNGLSFGRQGRLDWRAGRVEVDVPEPFFTSTFRFRLLPRLEDHARVAVDAVLVRGRR